MANLSDAKMFEIAAMAAATTGSIEDTNKHKAIGRGRVVGVGRVTPRDKVGRNEPCPCGSGLKFKKCCGKK